METKQQNIITQTAVGELITALTEEVLSFVEDEREANRLVAYMVIDLLYNSGLISSDF